MGIIEYKDYLTGINNRMGLFHIYEELSLDEKLGVLFFDIDNFKTVNDVYGHKKGDDTLIEFARIIKNTMPEEAIVARLGGDEFVAIVTGEYGKDFYENLAKKILESVKTLKEKDRAFEVISCSIGILQNHKISEGLDKALSCADKAMYFAKEQGKDTFVFYDDYQDIIQYEHSIEKDALRAMDEQRIIVKYHPVLHLQSSRMVCTEACCLWKTLDGKILGRKDFRSILEKADLIYKMDTYVFNQVCKDYFRFKELVKPGHRFAVQFSSQILFDEYRIHQLEEIMDRYGVPASCFEINIDEKIFSGRMAPEKIIEGMKMLTERGFSVAISHFGEDFSSVRYLKDMPISKLKLDGDYILDSLKDEEGMRVLQNIIKVGRGFKYTVIACKVDTEQSVVALAERGCDAATGDFFSKKLNLGEYIDFVEKTLADDADTISYYFKDDLLSDKRTGKAEIVGEDVELVKGISNKWGAVSFPGGPSQMNYLKFPTDLFDSESYTFSMWVKPYEIQNWVSALYVRYQGGFASFMPNISGGRSMYRINEDSSMDSWHDAMTSALPIGKWSFLACSYDAITSIVRLYVDGKLETVLSGVPNLQEPKTVWLGSDVFQVSYCGLISAFQVNRSALEEEEIKKRYESFLNEEGYEENEETPEVMLSEVEVHDPAIYEDVKNKKFYIYGTGAVGFTSIDLVHWKSLGIVVDGILPEAKEWTHSDAIWAPDIVEVNGEYRLYCSNSSWGVRQSCIFMATADSPAGPFVPKGIVVKTENSGNVNAIDANIIEDKKNNKQYMVYGSFWGGIHIIELDKETGFAKEDGLGKQIAVRPAWNDGAIEGPYIIYYPETDYYYLFVSYGSLTCDYNIRVGRSKSVTGPYLDYHGKNMVDPDDDNCSTGLMVSCGYRYVTGQAYMGPGHNSVLVRENGDLFLVNHIRKLAFNTNPGPGLLQIRKMIMTPDGWPIAMGQPYNAETLLYVRDELITGEYERIELRPSIPQGIQHSHPMKLLEGGRLEIASVIGKWTRIDDYTMELEYGPIKEFVYFEKGLDKEKNRTTIVMCGLTSEGICTWAKKEEIKYQEA